MPIMNRLRKIVNRRTGLMLLPLLLMLPLSFNGCVSHTQVSRPDWVQPIYFEDESLKWLDEHQPWPDSLYKDFNKILRHNEKVETIINGRHRTP